MKVKISYSIKLTPIQAKQLVKLAVASGYETLPKTRRELIKDILKAEGESVIETVMGAIDRDRR